jgi:hypothetical protein
MTSVTADTPVPYRISDLMHLIEERIGMLEGRNERPHLKALKNRIEAAVERSALPLHVRVARRSRTTSSTSSRRSSACRPTASRSPPSR